MGNKDQNKIHKKTIGKKLTGVFATAIIFLLAEFLVVFFLNNALVKGLTDSYKIEQLITSVQRGKEVLINLSELFEIRNINKILILKSNKKIAMVRLEAVEKTFREIETNLKSEQELLEEFSKAKDSLVQIKETIEDTYSRITLYSDSDPLSEDLQINLLLIGQFNIQCIESLERFSIKLNKNLYASFTNVYNFRNIPIYIGILLFILLTLLLILFGIILIRQIITPINSLMEATEKVAKGELTHKLPDFPDDELGKLALSFNKMIEELGLSRNALISEKLHSENIVKSLLNSLVILNSDWTIKSINQATIDMLGFTEEELIGKQFSIILQEDKEDAVKTKDHILKEGTVKNIEKIYKAKNGNHIPVLFSASSLYSQSNELEEMICVAQDITERKLIEEKEKKLIAADAQAEVERKKALELQTINNELQAAYKELELHQKELKETHEQLLQASRMTAMGEIAAGVAHELTQPLLGIKGFAAALLEDIKSFLEKTSKEKKDDTTDLTEKLAQDIMDDLKIILKQTDRMATIVDNMRNFARGGEAQFTAININKPIDDAFMLFSEQLKNYRITLVKNIPDEVPQILGNPSQLQQVFINLLSNSRDAINAKGTGGGQLILNYKLSSDKQYIQIEFIDDGIGMNKETLQKIFEPFFTTKPTGKGTGLGMAIVRKILDTHHSLINVESELNKGTKITISFPTVETI